MKPITVDQYSRNPQHRSCPTDLSTYGIFYFFIFSDIFWTSEKGSEVVLDSLFFHWLLGISLTLGKTKKQSKVNSSSAEAKYRVKT